MSEFVDCSFDQCKFAHMGSGYARLVNCTFLGSSLARWSTDAIELIGCTFTGRLRDVIFHGTVMQPYDVSTGGRVRNQFEGNDFSQATFRRVDFRGGIDLSLQKLPVGPGLVVLPSASDAAERLRSVDTTGWDATAKLTVEILIDDLEREHMAGQVQSFVMVDDFPRMARAAAVECLRRIDPSLPGLEGLPGLDG